MIRYLHLKNGSIAQENYIMCKNMTYWVEFKCVNKKMTVSHDQL